MNHRPFHEIVSRAIPGNFEAAQTSGGGIRYRVRAIANNRILLGILRHPSEALALDEEVMLGESDRAKAILDCLECDGVSALQFFQTYPWLVVQEAFKTIFAVSVGGDPTKNE